MAYSYVRYVGTGAQTNFTFSFPYITAEHIKVRLNDVLTTSFTFLSSSTIQITPAPANGVIVEIRRETPRDAVLVDYTNGSIFGESDLDLGELVALYHAQETQDSTDDCIRKDYQGNFDAQSGRVINADPAVDLTDLTTLSQVRTEISEAISSVVQTTVYNSQTFTATSGQSEFSLQNAYSPGNNSLAVFVNGAKLVVGLDYTEDDSTTFTLLIPASEGDVVVATTASFINPAMVSGTAISYLPDSVGAIETSVQDKLNYGDISFRDFGGVGDGNTDCTLALVRLATELKRRVSNVKVVIPRGRYKFSPQNHYTSAYAWRQAVEILDVSNVTIEGYGAVFVQDIPSTWTVGDPANYGNEEGPIQFRSTGNGTCNNITLKGFAVEMVKLAYSVTHGDGHAYGVALRGVKGFKLQDIKVTNAATDGIYLGPTYSNTYSGGKGKLIDCESYGANRNGLSVVQCDDMKYYGGYYESTSGGSYQAGIDLEPDIGQSQSNHKMIGVTARNNTSRGISAIRTSNLVISACDVYNNGREITVEGGCSRVRITRNNLTTNTTAGLGVDIVGNSNTDIDVEDNTIYMPGVPNLHVRVGYGGSTGMRNVRVKRNTLIGEGGVDVRNVSGICEVDENSHDVRLIGGNLSDTNLFTWYIEPSTAQVNGNNIRIDTSITWSGIQNKFQIVNGTAQNNKFYSHSGAVCVMYGRTSSFPIEYGYNEWSQYFYYDEQLGSDAFRIKGKGWAVRNEGSETYRDRIVTGGYARTVNASTTNSVGDITYNMGTTTGNPIAYRCTVAGSPGTWVGLWNKS